ncbi:GIY-YIG nuclease family protein [Ferruginibacter sp.]
MNYNLENSELTKVLKTAEKDLLSKSRIKFELSSTWRNQHVPDYPGIYALFEGLDNLIYIGETGNLRERMNDICRTVNHTFRRQFANKRYGVEKTKKKFDADIEIKLDNFFKEQLHLAFIEVNFGRIEIETYLVDKYQKALLNSEKKRKLKLTLDDLE